MRLRRLGEVAQDGGHREHIAVGRRAPVPGRSTAAWPNFLTGGRGPCRTSPGASPSDRGCRRRRHRNATPLPRVLAVLETEDLTGDGEHPIEHPVEREVGGHRVDTEPPRRILVQVAVIPRPEIRRRGRCGDRRVPSRPVGEAGHDPRVELRRPWVPFAIFNSMA